MINNSFSGEMAELTTKLASAAEGERRAKEQLEIRKDERNTEVTDLQNEVSWFRGEYDQLLLKVSFDLIIVISYDSYEVIWGCLGSFEVVLVHSRSHERGSKFDRQMMLSKIITHGAISGQTLRCCPKMITKKLPKLTKNV